MLQQTLRSIVGILTFKIILIYFEKRIANKTQDQDFKIRIFEEIKYPKYLRWILVTFLSQDSSRMLL